jgi:ribonuclease HII
VKQKPTTHTTFKQRWMHDITFIGNHAGIVGVDEAGRGCLVGPVVASAVFLKREFYETHKFKKACIDFNDSKQISPDKRLELMHLLEYWKNQNILHYHWAQASALEIDQYNILEATKLAMQRALDGLVSYAISSLILNKKNQDLPILLQNSSLDTQLPSTKSKLIIDGCFLKKFPYEHTNLVQGDSRSLAIAMASIVSKVQRDLLLKQLDLHYPQYGFKSHKGYATSQHRTAIQKYGLCPEHRQSFTYTVNLKSPTSYSQEDLLFERGTIDILS